MFGADVAQDGERLAEFHVSVDVVRQLEEKIGESRRSASRNDNLFYSGPQSQIYATGVVNKSEMAGVDVWYFCIAKRFVLSLLRYVIRRINGPIRTK